MSKTAENMIVLPVMPLRDIVVYPGLQVPLFVGRGKSIAALDLANKTRGREILVLTQKDANQENPNGQSVYRTGTICRVLNFMQLPDGTHKVLVEGLVPARVKALGTDGPYWEAEAQILGETGPALDDNVAAKLKGLQTVALESFQQYAQINPEKVANGVVEALPQLQKNPANFSYALAAHMPGDIAQKQDLLEQTNTLERLKRIATLLKAEVNAQQVKKEVETEISKEVKGAMEKTQREYFLNEQMKAIKKELNQGEESEVDTLEARIVATNLSEEAHDKAAKELSKLKNMSPQSAEATVIRNYLDALLSVPWNKPSEVNNDTKHAREVLDGDHYGLEKVKDKVVKSLAVQRRLQEKGDQSVHPKIICLVGPPGVGKTSICKSLAEATGREYVRMALGGVRDEAEIRGHRRTYIGSKPGKIIEKLTKAGTSNPLFVLDEIDKMGSDHRGDPAAAMLEVLDPEQNKAFNDHYLEVDYDLSDIMFVATANVWANIPRPLQDRMDTIFLGSYTEDEKLEIAKRHLVNKQRKAHGLDASECSFTDDALRDLVRHYTRESGVRNLERQIGNVCSEIVMELEDKSKTSVAVTAANLEQYAGKHLVEYDLSDANNEIGVVTGLAYTEVGGETLTIEAAKWPEQNGKFVVTGSLGDVMKESIQVAEGWLKARAGESKLGGLKIDDILHTTFRVHLPEGATPKDGPSAGAAMLTALFSVAAQKPIRKDIAMTGELSLRGDVTAIGGLREKLSAAARNPRYKTVLIPAANVKDLAEVPESVKAKLEIIPVSKIEEVLNHAIVGGFHPEEIPVMTPVTTAAQSQPHPTRM